MARTSISVLSTSLFTMLGLATAARAQCPLTFAPFTASPAGTQPIGIATADLNADGKLDLVYVNSGSNNISVCMGTGNGTFAAPVNYAVGTQPQYVALADLNGDGKPDIAVTNGTSNSISILINNGNGTFAAAATYATGSGPKQLALRDLNGDGHPDIAVANKVGSSVSVLLNSGTGTFGPRTDYATGGASNGVAIADFNADGISDLAVSLGGAGGSGGVLIYRGNGNGTFQAAVNTGGGGGNWINVADFNQDGAQDLIVLNQNSNAAYIQFGNGNGTFQAPVTIAAPNVGLGQGIAIGDINGDGRPDLVIPNANANVVEVRTGNPGGTFSAPVSVPTAGGPVFAAIGDFNGDGSPDLAVTNNTANQTSIVLSTTPVVTFTAQPRSWAMTLGGNVTMAVTVSGSTFQWYHNGVPMSTGGHIAGTNTAQLDILGVTPADAGVYTVAVTNGCAHATSDPALVGVFNPCPGDFNGDGSVDFFDYLDFVDAFSVGC